MTTATRTPNDDERALLEAWRAGDAAAGEVLFERHFDAIYAFFASKLTIDVSDLVQRTFLGCLEARDRFRGDCSFRTFLYAIARHELYGYFRARHRGQCVGQSLRTLAEHHRAVDRCARKGRAHECIDGLAHMRPVALQPVGLPGQVERGQQRQAAAGMVGQGTVVQAGVAEHLLAVHGDHQRGGIGHHDLVRPGGLGDAQALLRGNAGLLVQARRAAGAMAELAKVFRHHGHPAPGGSQRRAELGGQRRLAGALGTEQADHEGVAHRASVRASADQARQPASDSSTNTA